MKKRNPTRREMRRMNRTCYGYLASMLIASALMFCAMAIAARASTLHIEQAPFTCTTDSDCIRQAYAWGCTESVTENHDDDDNETGTYTSHGFDCSLSRFIAKARSQTR